LAHPVQYFAKLLQCKRYEHFGIFLIL